MTDKIAITYTERPPNGILPCCGAFVREDIPFPFHCSCAKPIDRRSCKHLGEVLRQMSCKTCGAGETKIVDVYRCLLHDCETTLKATNPKTQRNCLACQVNNEGYTPNEASTD